MFGARKFKRAKIKGARKLRVLRYRDKTATVQMNSTCGSNFCDWSIL